jgi:biopolymer transport protein ExbB
MEQQGLDLIDIIHKGAIATYPLILLSIVSVTVVLERLWFLKNIGSITLRITESLLEPIKKGQRDLAIAICKQNSQNPAARIFLNVLERNGDQRLEAAGTFATEAMFEETQKLKKHLWILGTVASSAPRSQLRCGDTGPRGQLSCGVGVGAVGSQRERRRRQRRHCCHYCR